MSNKVFVWIVVILGLLFECYCKSVLVMKIIVETKQETGVLRKSLPLHCRICSMDDALTDHELTLRDKKAQGVKTMRKQKKIMTIIKASKLEYSEHEKYPKVEVNPARKNPRNPQSLGM